MGPISIDLSEIDMWSIHYAKPGEQTVSPAGKPGWQPDGSYLTPEGQRLRTELEQTAYLRTVQDWITRPQIKTVPGVAGVAGVDGFEKQYQPRPSQPPMRRSQPPTSPFPSSATRTASASTKASVSSGPGP